MKYRHFIMALAVSAAASFGPAYGRTTEGRSVGAAIERVASPLAGRIGFAAQEIGGNEVIAFNGDESFRTRPELVTAQGDRNLDFEADPRDHATLLAMLQLLFAVVVFTNSSETPVPDRDRAIAEIARSLFDYFLVAQKAMQ